MIPMETGAIYKKHFDCVYFLKNVHAAIASNMMAMTHKDESLIPVFLAMRTILCQECIFVSTISTGRNRSVMGWHINAVTGCRPERSEGSWCFQRPEYGRQQAETKIPRVARNDSPFKGTETWQAQGRLRGALIRTATTVCWVSNTR